MPLELLGAASWCNFMASLAWTRQSNGSRSDIRFELGCHNHAKYNHWSPRPRPIRGRWWEGQPPSWLLSMWFRFLCWDSVVFVEKHRHSTLRSRAVPVFISLKFHSQLRLAVDTRKQSPPIDSPFFFQGAQSLQQTG